MQGAAAAGFFRNLRILEEEKQPQSKSTPTPSLRENPQGFSWQSISAQADSKQNAKNLTTPQAEAKVDSSTATTLSQPAKDSRSFDKEAQNVSEPQAEAKVDSSNDYSASAECVDCHADFQSARNDDKAKNLNESAQDSRSFTQNAKNLTTPQAEAVEMRNRCFQAVGEGIYLSGNEQAHRAESVIYRSNATPLSIKAAYAA